MKVQPPKSCVVYTPPSLARAVIAAVARSRPNKWLEPSCGEGAFLKALAHHGVGPKQIVGIDIQPRRSPFDSFAKVHRGIDFLKWSRSTRSRFDAIVGNPPYVRISSLPPALRDNAISVVGPDGMVLDARANLWAAFVLASCSLLTRNGTLAFVLPAAFQYANYATPVHEALLARFGRVEAYRCFKPLFDGVKDGAVVLLATKFGDSSQAIKWEEHQSSSLLIQRLAAKDRRVLKVAQKSKPDFGNQQRQMIPLGQIIRLGIGAVTGHSKYFLMTETRRRFLGLPAKACVPVLSKTSHLCSACIDTRTWKLLRGSDQRVWLFRPTKLLSKHIAVARYLRLGKRARLAFKVSNRSPWYQTPMPSSPDVFLSGQWQNGPWLAINETERLGATNTLYVGRFRSRGMSRDEKAAWGLCVMSNPTLRSWEKARRHYPDGLVKCEPGDLSRVLVPTIPKVVDGAALVYRRAVSLLISGEATEARALADAWIAGKLAASTPEGRSNQRYGQWLSNRLCAACG